LKADAVLLDEVVAIGYATVKRKDLTGSVASVNSKELSKVPTSDITQALAGRMAGVQVMQSEGAPGASISIRVRGGISITQSNEPLYIIDGFPSEDGMSTLDPAEIETIDILKDASAPGCRGSQ
jgi:outer membrane receptor protein involved in Fe transport